MFTVITLISENAPNLRTVILGEFPNLVQREPSCLSNPNLPVVIQYNGEDWECSRVHAVRTNKLAELIGENRQTAFSLTSVITVIHFGAYLFIDLHLVRNTAVQVYRTVNSCTFVTSHESDHYKIKNWLCRPQSTRCYIVWWWHRA